MTTNSTVDTNPVLVLGKYLMDVDMFPVFFTAHFAIACVIVREDSKDLGPRFRQNHPFAIWVCTVVAGLSGVFVANFLFGDPLIEILKENQLLIYLTFIWYLMNYSPFDIVYKLFLLPPVILPAAMLQELLRVRFIYLGFQQAAKLYPNAHIISLLGGAIKGNGYGFIKVVERLIRGKWTPSSNEILEVTYFAKSGLYASVAFLLHHLQIIPAPIEYVYLAICVVFVVFRLIVTIGGVKDPLLPFELPICMLFFGSDSGIEEKEEEKDEQKEKKTK